MSLFKKLFSKKKNQEKDKKIMVEGAFNFDEYPSLFFEYLEYEKLVSRTYKFSVMDGDGLDVGDKYEKAKGKEEVRRNIFAKAIFDVFNSHKPKLENRRKNYQETKDWDEVFENKNFEELNDKQKFILIGLIECNYVFVLPKKYYIAKERSFQTTQFISLNKMKKLYEETKKA